MLMLKKILKKPWYLDAQYCRADESYMQHFETC